MVPLSPLRFVGCSQARFSLRGRQSFPEGLVRRHVRFLFRRDGQTGGLHSASVSRFVSAHGPVVLSPWRGNWREDILVRFFSGGHRGFRILASSDRVAVCIESLAPY